MRGGFAHPGFARAGFAHMGFVRGGIGRGAFVRHPAFFQNRFAFRHHRFVRNRFAFVGAGFYDSYYDSCYARIWTAYGWQWTNVCYY
jgi:hypothetical protein